MAISRPGLILACTAFVLVLGGAWFALSTNTSPASIVSDSYSVVQVQASSLQALSQQQPQAFNLLMIVIFGIILLGVLLGGMYLMYMNIYEEHDLTKKYSVPTIVKNTYLVQQYIMRHQEDTRDEIMEQLENKGWDPELVDHAFRNMPG